ncbi:proteinase [Xylogone sp. PMI_703]|nr:proteinase [Xylogone sp. PMI_703]
MINWGKDHEAHSPFSWMELIPSEQLAYVDCFDGFRCARLSVPLNWNVTDHSIGPRVAIAVIKLPAKVPVTDPRYGGAIITNPGGPGESGVHQVLSSGKHIQTIVDSAESPSIAPSNSTGAKFFDIISFDPRGVNNTTHRLKCFPDAFKQQAWSLGNEDYGVLWETDSILGLEWSRAQALGGSCSRAHDENDIVRYSNTAQVVEDMVGIIERHAEWRQEEARKLSAQLPSTERRGILDHTAWNTGQEKIQYWGQSYGTLLGETFAAMHPDRVSRLVLDGVVNPIDHYKGDWLTNLLDSDKIITAFCNYCFKAGPEKCPLYTGKSGSDVENRLEKIMMSLKNDPIPVPASEDRGPEIITYGDALLRMLSGMYFPYAKAEKFFQQLAQLEQRNGTDIAVQKQSWLKVAEISEQCQRDGPFSDACASSNYISGMGPTRTIGCMDIGGIDNLTKDNFRNYMQELRNQSKWISTSWARNKMGCLGFTVKPAWTFQGPISGNTSHPLLIIGNTHDTVTPLQSARFVSTLFPGSTVVQHDSDGHCSYSNPSLCTGKILRNYFQTGEVPKSGTVCSPEYKPFIECRKLEENDQKMWEAMVAITGAAP